MLSIQSLMLILLALSSSYYTKLDELTLFKNAVAGTEITREALISSLTGKSVVIFSTPIRELASLSLGDRGSSVSELQQQLKQLGYYKNEITGIYGNAVAADKLMRIPSLSLLVVSTFIL